MHYDSEFIEYKGFDIHLFSGYVGIPGVEYRETDNPPKPRRFCWIYEVPMRGITLCDTGFPDKQSALDNAKLAIDTKPVTASSQISPSFIITAWLT